MGIQLVLFADRFLLPTDQGTFGGVADVETAKLEVVRVMDDIGVGSPRHPGEEVDLALLGFLDDPDRTFVIREIVQGQFPGESLAVAGEGIQKQAKILGTAIKE